MPGVNRLILSIIVPFPEFSMHMGGCTFLPSWLGKGEKLYWLCLTYRPSMQYDSDFSVFISYNSTLETTYSFRFSISISIPSYNYYYRMPSIQWKRQIRPQNASTISLSLISMYDCINQQASIHKWNWPLSNKASDRSSSYASVSREFLNWI